MSIAFKTPFMREATWTEATASAVDRPVANSVADLIVDVISEAGGWADAAFCDADIAGATPEAERP